MDYLYHYTNINSLAMILSNRCIRLNSLKNMDDAEEIITANSKFLGKYCMVSSWTEIEEESVPFWGLYTKNMSGVRIKMQKNPFKIYELRLSYYKNGKKFQSYCPESILNENSVYLYPSLPFLRKVEYTDNTDLLYPRIFDYIKKKDNGNYDLSGTPININKYKRTCWSFQQEWRYGLLFFPHTKDGQLKLKLEANADDMPFWYCDLEITEEAFNDIEVMLGPKMTIGDKKIVSCLIDKYCPTATIVESRLMIN